MSLQINQSTQNPTQNFFATIDGPASGSAYAPVRPDRLKVFRMRSGAAAKTKTQELSCPCRCRLPLQPDIEAVYDASDFVAGVVANSQVKQRGL